MCVVCLQSLLSGDQPGKPGMTGLADPGDLCSLLGIPFSQEQLDVICSPLEPQVIVAGAGTGKTTVMAARVVWRARSVLSRSWA